MDMQEYDQNAVDSNAGACLLCNGGVIYKRGSEWG